MFKKFLTVVALGVAMLSFGCSSAEVPKEANPDNVKGEAAMKQKEADKKVEAGEMTNADAEVAGASIGGKGGPKKTLSGAQNPQ